MAFFLDRTTWTRNTGLLSYLAGDRLRRDAVHGYARALLKPAHDYSEMITYARADPNELPTMADCLVHGSSSASRGPLETPLIEAVMNESEDMIDTLLDGGADRDMRGYGGMTAYGVAIAYRLGRIV